MEGSIDERVISVIIGYESTRKWKELEELTSISRTRWKDVANRKAKPRTEDLEALTRLYPQWALWLTTGKIMPEAGFTSPEWEKAEKLNQKERA